MSAGSIDVDLILGRNAQRLLKLLQITYVRDNFPA